MTPKDRVKVNVYKQLLNEEKTKHKRYVTASVSVFLVGIVSVTSYQNYIKDGLKESASPVMVIRNGVKVEKKNQLDLDHFYSKDLFEERKIEVDTDQFFGFDYQS